MFCTNCGSSLDDKANFCSNCGVSMKPGIVNAPLASQPQAERKLVRPTDDKWIAGVCSGFARYFGIDLTLVRLLWVLTIILAGTGFLVYIICWIVIPREDSPVSRTGYA